MDPSSYYRCVKTRSALSIPLIGEIKAEEKTPAARGRVSQGERQRRGPRGADAGIGEVVLDARTALHDAACTRTRRMHAQGGWGGTSVVCVCKISWGGRVTSHRRIE